MNRAPAATWRWYRAVRAGSPITSGAGRVRVDGPRRTGCEAGDRQRTREDLPLRLVAHHRLRLRELEPSHGLELVIVIGEVAPGRFHQEVVDRLVDAPAGPHERVPDVTDRSHDAD